MNQDILTTSLNLNVSQAEAYDKLYKAYKEDQVTLKKLRGELRLVNALKIQYEDEIKWLEQDTSYLRFQLKIEPNKKLSIYA